MRARRRRRDHMVPAPSQLDSGVLRGDSRSTGRSSSRRRVGQRYAQGSPSSWALLCGTYIRRARVERVHAEWQRLEAAASAAAEAAAERERAFRSRCVHTAQVCANLRMLFWRAWAQKPVGRTKRCQFLGEYFSCRDRYIFSRACRLCKASGVGRQMVIPRAVSAIAPRQPRRIPRPPQPHAMVLPLSP